MSLDVGDLAPDFTLPTDGGGEVKLSDLLGRKVVIYFYPKDDTPGCTREANDFKDYANEFVMADTTVIGISKDSPAKHDKFKTKYSLPFDLASDEEGKVADAYEVWKEKSMYGKTFLGIERSTFLIDKGGVIRQAWRKVTVPGHVEEVLKAAQDLGD